MSRKPTSVGIAVRVAPRKSKMGWIPVMGELPPDTFAQLETFRLANARTRSDVVCEAVQVFLQRKQKAA